MVDELPRNNRRHEFVRTVEAVASVASKRECQSLGQVFRASGREIVQIVCIVWIVPSATSRREKGKDILDGLRGVS